EERSSRALVCTVHARLSPPAPSTPSVRHRARMFWSQPCSHIPLAKALLPLSSVACSWAAVHMPCSLQLCTLNLLFCSSSGDSIAKEEHSHRGKEQDDAQDLASTSRPRCKRDDRASNTGYRHFSSCTSPA